MNPTKYVLYAWENDDTYDDPLGLQTFLREPIFSAQYSNYPLIIQSPDYLDVFLTIAAFPVSYTPTTKIMPYAHFAALYNSLKLIESMIQDDGKRSDERVPHSSAPKNSKIQ